MNNAQNLSREEKPEHISSHWWPVASAPAGTWLEVCRSGRGDFLLAYAYRAGHRSPGWYLTNGEKVPFDPTHWRLAGALPNTQDSQVNAVPAIDELFRSA